MRNLTTLTAVAVAAATTAVLATVPAMADPIGNNGQPITPRPCDVVGVGVPATQYVFDQFSLDYNGQKGGNQTASCTTNPTRYLYSWDAATGPSPGPGPGHIVTKKGCAPIPRPSGTTAIALLGPCVDFVRSARDRSVTDPTSVSFIVLAGGAVTYATQPGSHAPMNLTLAQLAGIYKCTITNWGQVGGTSAPIHAYLPGPGSDTRSHFLASIGISTPGPCVSDANGTLAEDEGVNPALNTAKKDVIFPYSVGPYLAQRYHSAKCLNPGCTPNASGQACVPAGSQNKYGCDLHGTMVLNEADGTAPTVPFPLTSTSKNAAINPGFSAALQYTLFDVVAAAEGTIPARLKPILGPSGWVCTNSAAKADMRHYGFAVLPACGRAH